MGTDPNRNFDFQWATVGSSDQPCSDTFHGSGPFSEAETRNVRDFVMPRRDQLKHFIDVHSYSQIVITPWGYTSEVPDDWDEVMGEHIAIIANPTSIGSSKGYVESTVDFALNFQSIKFVKAIIHYILY